MLKYNLGQLFLHLTLAMAAFATILQFGGARLGVLVFIAVSASYAFAFCVSPSRKNREAWGAKGAILGWIVAMLVPIADGYVPYVFGLASPPKFDGDGLVPWAVAICLGLVPVALIGCVIGHMVGVAYHVRAGFSSKPT